MVRIAGILSSAESDRMFACFRGKGTLKDLLIPSVKIPETVTSHDITPSSAKTGIREAHVYSRAGLKQAVHHSIRAGASYTGREAGKAQRKTESKKNLLSRRQDMELKLPDGRRLRIKGGNI
ncbi:MAG TPA: hypothetical protein VMT63_05610 [Bacteroidales bacterium]|nr:hypothetical protein [Bacteroidales bacterium]